MPYSRKYAERSAWQPEVVGDGRRELVIIGAGEHAKVVISAAESMKQSVRCVLDHDPQRNATYLCGYPVEAYSESTLPLLIKDDQLAIIAVGDNEARRTIAVSLDKTAWATVVHHSAIVDRRARIGHGTLLCAASVVNPDATVGQHVIVNTAAVVEHDVVVGDYCHIAPNVTLCGKVTIGEGAIIGAGSVVLPGRSVGSWCKVGAGAVITHDVPAGATAMGVPGRIDLR